MKHFVQGRNSRSNSPHTGQPRANGRAQIGANSKITIPNTTLRQPNDTLHHNQGSAQDVGQGNQPPLQQQPAQLRHPSHAIRPKEDPYGTDAESIDTTLPRRSEPDVLIEDSQKRDYGNDEGFGDDESTEHEDGNDEGEEEAGHGDEGNGDDREYHQEGGFSDQEWALIHQLGLDGDDPAIQRQVVQKNREETGFGFDPNDSYPSTTSGVPEGFPEEHYNQAQHPSSDEFVAQNEVSPSPQRPAAKAQPRPQVDNTALFNHIGHAAQPIPVRSTPMYPPPPASSKPPARKDNRVDMNTTTNRDLSRQARVKFEPASQLQTHTIVPTPPSTGPTTQHNAAQIQSSVPRQHAWRHNPGPKYQMGQEVVNNVSNDQPSTRAPAKTNHIPRSKPLAPIQPEEEEAASQALTPIRDYDDPELFAKAYDDLKDESFDHVPRRGDPVLDENMLKESLDERLRYVQKELGNTEKARFFSDLPIREWEEAGDWFLDQFQGIIDRTKDARKKKRAFAAEFEKEVEMRHIQVTKKQKIVEDALATMRNQGEGLLSKSPAKKG